MSKNKEQQVEEQPIKSVKEELKKKHTIIKEEVKQELDNYTGIELTDATNRAICHFAALGFTKKEIAIQLSLTPNRVGGVINSETGKFMIMKHQREIFVENPQRMFATEVPAAFRRVAKIVRDKKSKNMEALAASKEIFDRALGKPVQEVKTEGSAIRQLIEMLDAQNKTIEAKKANKDEIVDATYSDVYEVKPEAEEKDDMDQWLADNFK